ncbi:CAP domain-containing protein [Nocardiopsis sp. N85]|uniref:CAP domain-containing protein n=1 Tax=Nocardiopsis sp. N85 TaxID=3029400 RepID=UPI00237F2B7C|nr:CAP domain-containing protein [Nocardiopsis sp. N85]MDE3720100.1 CAP domain-containing protein [Nocardiopsis sp. N85]
MARGRRGTRRTSTRRSRRRRSVPFFVTLAAVPLGLTLAGTLLVTGTGEELNPFRNTADGSAVPDGSTSSVSTDPPAPDASEEDDFFVTPGDDAPIPVPSPAGDNEPQSADVTASSSPEEREDDGREESDGGSGGGGGGESAGGGQGGSGGGGGGGGGTSSAVTDEVVRLVNAERAGAGCSSLRVDSRLTGAAQEHSEDMDRRNYMSHQNPDGEGPGERAARHGYDAWGAENVAKGQTSAAQVMDAWMNSEGHRANILNCGLKAIGVGESGNAWTQKFGWE